MKYGLAILFGLGAAFAGSTARAAGAGGRVVYVESFDKNTASWLEWGTVTLRPSYGPWQAIWLKRSIDEQTAGRILEAAGRATSAHWFTFFQVNQDPYWTSYFAATNYSQVRIGRITSVPSATTTGSGVYLSLGTVKGQIKQIDIYGGGSTLVTVGSQNCSVSVPHFGGHYSRLFTVCLGGADADHDVEFRNVQYYLSVNWAAVDGTSVNSYKARNQ